MKFFLLTASQLLLVLGSFTIATTAFKTRKNCILRPKTRAKTIAATPSFRLHLQTNEPHQRELREEILPGVWTSRGYGYAFNSTGIAEFNSSFWRYETNISCIPIPPTEIPIFLDRIGDNGTIIDLDDIRFDYTGTYQSGCANGDTPGIDDVDYKRDALFDFDVLVRAFQENYALFDLFNVNWDNLTEQVRASLTSNSTDSELFAAFRKVLEPLKDWNIELDNSDDDSINPVECELCVRLVEEGQKLGVQDVDSYIDDQLAKLIKIAASYMRDSELYPILNESEAYYYGHFNGTDIGYILLTDFDADPNTTPIKEALDQAFLALVNSTAMVLDIRINFGSMYDVNEMALFVASYFFSERTLVWTKSTRDRNGSTDAVPVYIEPGNETTRYNGPVIVITSGATANEAERFALAMAQLPQTTLLGRNTAGGLAYIGYHNLPNGWESSLSCQAVAAPNGTIYDTVGIPPDVVTRANVAPLEERQSGIDSWLETTLEYLNATGTNTTPPPPSVPSNATVTFSNHIFLAIIAVVVSFTYWNILV